MGAASGRPGAGRSSGSGATGGARQLPLGIVVNPTSALGRGARVAHHVLAACEKAGYHAIEISGSSADECASRLSGAISRGLRGLILVGGDGLLSLVLQVPGARALPLGVVPAGTGNDFARQFGLPRSTEEAVARILGSLDAPRPVDLGVVTREGHEPRWFAGGLSLGFDAAINRRANAIRLPLGPVKYQLALLAEIAFLRVRTFTVRATGSDGGEFERSFEGILSTVMNTRTIGGGIPLAPRAIMHDGLLDLVEVTRCTKLRLLSVLGLLARAKHEGLPEVTITRVQSVRLEAGNEVAFADGERVGPGPFEVRVAPAALALLA